MYPHITRTDLDESYVTHTQANSHTHTAIIGCLAAVGGVVSHQEASKQLGCKQCGLAGAGWAAGRVHRIIHST